MKKYIFALVLIILGWFLILLNIFGSKNKVHNTKYVIDEDIKVIDIYNALGYVNIKRGKENTIEIPKNITYEIKDNTLYIKYIESLHNKKLRKNDISVSITYKDDLDVKVKNFAGTLNVELPYGKHSISDSACIANISVIDDINFEKYETFAKSTLKVENNENSKTSLKLLNVVGTYKINRK